MDLEIRVGNENFARRKAMNRKEDKYLYERKFGNVIMNEMKQGKIDKR